MMTGSHGREAAKLKGGRDHCVHSHKGPITEEGETIHDRFARQGTAAKLKGGRDHRI